MPSPWRLNTFFITFHWWHSLDALALVIDTILIIWRTYADNSDINHSRSVIGARGSTSKRAAASSYANANSSGWVVHYERSLSECCGLWLFRNQRSGRGFFPRWKSIQRAFQASLSQSWKVRKNNDEVAVARMRRFHSPLSLWKRLRDEISKLDMSWKVATKLTTNITLDNIFN